MTQANKAQQFVDLHNQGELFILPNPWDAGSAKILTNLGFKALATTSAGYAFSQGKLDTIGKLSRDDAIAHARTIIAASPLPVSADLENGFGDSPEAVQQTIITAFEAGLAGCTIEDTSGLPDKPIYERAHAIERIAAAVETVRSLPAPFVLTARAENYLHGRPDLDDTLERLLGYESVGADVLYAPGLPDLTTIKTVCSTVKKPINVVAGIRPKGATIKDFKACGVTRVSLGSSLARVAIGASLNAARTLLDSGNFEAFDKAASFAEIESLLQ
jgi:2-methylisocitrate lyase-like PEP mutase family enzyme